MIRTLAPGALTTVYRVMLRLQATRARLLGLGALALVGVLLGFAVGASATDPLQAGTHLVNAFGLSPFAPLATLVLASASLGDLVDDGTLVYLWLRPVARWRLALGALLATLTVAVPLVLAPLVLAAVVTGAGRDLIVGTATAGALAVLVYSAVFQALGLRVRRALGWGLGYILIWEGFVANAGDNAARLTIRAYTRSVLARATGVPLRLAEISSGVAVAVPLVVAALAFWYTCRRLDRQDVA